VSNQRVAVKYLIRGEAQKRRPRFEVGTEVYVFRPYGGRSPPALDIRRKAM